MRFLCISDIHGHAHALRQVLKEAEHWGYDQIVVCGDLCFPGPDPLGVWKLLIQNQAVCVQGMSDKAVSELNPDRLQDQFPDQSERIEQLRRTRRELGQVIVARLGQLQKSARLPLESGHEMLVIHGSPVDPTEPFTFDQSDEEMMALVGDDPADIIVCGGSHSPFQRQIGDLRIVGVGSVGEAPTDGVAYATIITSLPVSTSVEQYHVELQTGERPPEPGQAGQL
jgi:predicted phosphodiesterase